MKGEVRMKCKFRAIIKEKKVIKYFDLIDMIYPGFSMRELVHPWLLVGGIPDEYTGKDDGCGVGVYSGDVVRKIEGAKFSGGREQTWIVTFRYSTWMLDNTTKSAATSYPSFYANIEDMEVIGNIHINPEYKLTEAQI